MSGNDNIVEVNWKEEYEKEHKLRQEAEAETILVKGIGMNSPEMRDEKKKGEAMTTEIKTLEARVKFLQDNLRGAVKLYKDEKERRQFAEKELGDLKKVFTTVIRLTKRVKRVYEDHDSRAGGLRCRHH